jgi:hypothetical protein
MIKDTLIVLFNRDLTILFKEINAYSDEVILWQRAEGTSNPAGNLALHLVGNLNEYVGRQLGQVPYTRNRPLEFSATDVPKSELLGMIDNTRILVEKSIKGLTVEQFFDDYPENVLGYTMSVSYFLIHLHGHLTYHLGQINYHRRILNSNIDPSV